MSQRALNSSSEEDVASGERRSRIVPAIVGSALLMVTLEVTVMANALPSIAHALREDPLRLNVAMTMYLVSSAVFLPVCGWVADTFGARRVLVASMLLFAVSSAACGLSQSLLQLVLARIAQGASGAMLMPVARLLLVRTTPRHELVGALATLTIPATIGPVLGAPLGGFIVTYFDWRWIFFINLPIAVTGVVLVLLFVPDVKEEGPASPLDWRGVLLAGLGLAAFVTAFDNVAQPYLPAAAVPGLFALALAAFCLYVRHARGNPRAVIDLNLFRKPAFLAANVGSVFMRTGMSALPFLLAMLLQVGLGMSAFAAGTMTFISGAASLLMKFAAPPILRRFGFRAVLVVNGALVALTIASLGLITPSTPHWLVMAALAIGGFFRSLQFSSINTLAFADLQPESMSRASTMLSMSGQVVNSIGIAGAAVLLRAFQTLRGETHLTSGAVGAAIVVIGLLGFLSVAWFAKLPPGTGDDLQAPRSA